MGLLDWVTGDRNKPVTPKPPPRPKTPTPRPRPKPASPPKKT